MNLRTWVAVVEGSLEAIWIVDAISLRIRLANRAAEDMLGVARHGFEGQPIVDLAATPEDLFFWEDVAAGLASDIHSETLLRRADGGTLSVDRRVSRLGVEGCDSVFIVAVRDISEQRRVEGELERLIAELRATLESTADGILVTDMDGGIRSYNQRFAELWALPEDLQLRRNDLAVFDWMVRYVLNAEHYETRLSAILRTPVLETNDIIVLRSGRVLERVTLPQYARGRAIGRVYSFRDITQRLADEARLQLAAKVFESSLDAIFIADAEFRIISVNPSCQRLTGMSHAELEGCLAHELVFELGDENSSAMFAERLRADGAWEGELWHRGHQGQNAPCMVSLVRVNDEHGEPAQYIGVFKDLSETVAARQRIEELAYNDVLTGLPNRMLLAERGDFLLATAQRDKASFAILFLDLDRFKKINDSLGHQFGDRVLIEVAERIKACLRQVDTAARLGGDEFVLLLHEVDALGAEVTARRILESLAKPYRFEEMNFSLSCSIGIALYPDDGLSMDDLIKNADSAMYHVKERGRSDFRFYQRQMNVDLLSRMKLDNAMRGALAEGGFRLHYQPQIDLSSGRVFGAEALIRWNDAAMGEIVPGRFIPVAEETGLIVAIGDWVLREAVRQAAQWHGLGLPLDIAVNVSALQFRQADFIERVASVLSEFGLPPAALELELTESLLIQDVEEVMKRLDALAALGVKMSIDDFGTGYSSLSYLKRFPLHRLKIDQSFVRDLPENDSDAGIVTAIINMARSLGLRVIAEGVETHLQREFLLTAGCLEMQGYLCSPAMPAEQFFEFAHVQGGEFAGGQPRVFAC